MILGFVIVLDGKLGAAVQAAQAHGTVFLNPCWFSVLHLDGIHRTVFGAQTAADAGILHMKVTGLAQGLIEAGVHRLEAGIL